LLNHISAPLPVVALSSDEGESREGHEAVGLNEPLLNQEGAALDSAILPHPLRFKKFDPKGPYNCMLYPRETIEKLTDFLTLGEAWKDKTLQKFSPQPLAIGATVKTKKLAELLVVGHCSTKSLVVFLPPEYEMHINEMVARPPEVWNIATTDLLHNQTYLVFRAGCGDAASSLLVLHDEIYRQENLERVVATGPKQVPSFQGCCGGEDAEDEFFAVILVSGNSVAIGGFVCDQQYAEQCQCCAMSAQSHVYYSDVELTAAAAEKKRVGNWPTAFQLHYWNDTAIDLTAPVYRRRSKLGW
jgi:hypothetical protein